MTIFSKLSGTMQNIFMFGKKGPKISSSGTDGIEFLSNDETTTIPISVGTPTSAKHAVPLSYFSSVATDSTSGTTDPTSVMGKDGDIYVKVSASTGEIIAVYFKVDSVWKEFTASGGSGSASNYTFDFSASDFTLNSGIYTLTVLATTHGLTDTPIIEIYELDGTEYNRSMVETRVDSTNDVIVKSNVGFNGRMVLSGK